MYLTKQTLRAKVAAVLAPAIGGLSKKLLLTPLGLFLLGNAGAHAYSAYSGDKRPIHKINELENKLMSMLAGGSAAAGDYIGSLIRHKNVDKAYNSASELYDNFSRSGELAKEFMNNARFIGNNLKNTLLPISEKVKALSSDISNDLSNKAKDIEAAIPAVKQLGTAIYNSPGLAVDIAKPRIMDAVNSKKEELTKKISK